MNATELSEHPGGDADAEEELRDALQADRRSGAGSNESDPDPGEEECGPEGLLLEPARQPLAGEQAAHEQPDDEEGDHDRVCRPRCVPLEHSLGEHIGSHHRGGEERADGGVARVGEDPSRTLPEVRDDQADPDDGSEDPERVADRGRRA